LYVLEQIIVLFLDACNDRNDLKHAAVMLLYSEKFTLLCNLNCSQKNVDDPNSDVVVTLDERLKNHPITKNYHLWTMMFSVTQPYMHTHPTLVECNKTNGKCCHEKILSIQMVLRRMIAFQIPTLCIEAFLTDLIYSNHKCMPQKLCKIAKHFLVKECDLLMIEILFYEFNVVVGLRPINTIN